MHRTEAQRVAADRQCTCIHFERLSLSLFPCIYAKLENRNETKIKSKVQAETEIEQKCSAAAVMRAMMISCTLHTHTHSYCAAERKRRTDWQRAIKR